MDLKIHTGFMWEFLHMGVFWLEIMELLPN